MKVSDFPFPSFVPALFFILLVLAGCDSQSPSDLQTETPPVTLEEGTFEASYRWSEDGIDFVGAATFGYFSRDDTTYFALLMVSEPFEEFDDGIYVISMANQRTRIPEVGSYPFGQNASTRFIPSMIWSVSTGAGGGVVRFIEPESGTMEITNSTEVSLIGFFSFDTEHGETVEGSFHASLKENFDDKHVLTHR